jgi:hypothetical protein
MANIELKKQIHGTKAVSLIYAKPCRDNCPIAEDCNFYGDAKPCKPHAEYTKAVYDAALDVCGKTFNTKEGVRIGCLIIPMFSILFDLQLEYSALERMTFMTEKGDIKMHPILSELRKQTALIEKMWNNLGFKEPIPQFNPKHGDGSYADEIME